MFFQYTKMHSILVKEIKPVTFNTKQVNVRWFVAKRNDFFYIASRMTNWCYKILFNLRKHYSFKSNFSLLFSFLGESELV